MVWALDVDGVRVRRRLRLARRLLSDLLHPDYARQAHVTLELCGFPGADAPAADEYTLLDLQRQVAALQAARLAPFTLALNALTSFDSAPYLGVRDASGSIETLRRCLTLGGGERLWGGHVPHVTVGLYRRRHPARLLAGRLRAARNMRELRWRVESLRLMAYDPRRIGGKLRALAEFELASGQLRWLAPWPAGESC